MIFASWFKLSNQLMLTILGLVFLIAWLMQPARAMAQAGFEFTGENCIEAYDLGELEVATVSMWLRVGEPPEEELSLLSTHDWDVSAANAGLTRPSRVSTTRKALPREVPPLAATSRPWQP